MANKRANREEVFAREYVKDLNGARAAIAAGYAKKSARVTASRLLTKANIKAQIAELQQKHLEKCDITAERVLAEIGRLGFANMLDYIKTQPDGSAFTDLSKLTRDEAAAIHEIIADEYTEGRGEDARDVKRTKIKLADKRGSLELLGRHLRIFTDKFEVTGLENIAEALKRARGRMRDARLRSN